MSAKQQKPLRKIGEQIHAIMSVHPLNSQDQEQFLKQTREFIPKERSYIRD